MAREEDYYSILGIDPGAPDREVKRAYYRLARELHPDRAKSQEEGRANAEQLAVISKAYNTLKDRKKREAYDASRGGKKSSPAPAKATPAKSSPEDSTPPAPVGSSSDTIDLQKIQKEAQKIGQISDSTRMSASDLATQRVITAQKAFVKGMQLYKAGEFKKALPFFEAAAQNDPESEPHYHMKLAVCLTKSKSSFTRAVAAAERACEMDAYNMDFKLGLGEIYETVGIASKAAGVYREILKWDPDHERAKFRLSLVEKLEQSNKPPKGFLEKMFPSLFDKKK